MSQTQLPTQQMQQRKAMQIQQMLAQGQQMLQLAPPQQPGADPSQPPQQDPQTAQTQQMMQQGMQQLQRLSEEPTIDQVLYFLRDNRAKSFVLDIETDSTIMADENAEKQRRTEFVGVLAQLLPQLSQMITAEPKTASFCGDILKFSTAPFRVGRSLEGSIDELVAQMEAKSEQGKGDDPTTAMGKIQLQIEQMKQQTAKEKNAQDAALKQAELAQKDKHKEWELMNERAIKQAEFAAKARDAEGKVQIQNQKAMESREAHQAHMIEKNQDMGLQRQKGELAMQAHAMKQQAAAMRPPQGRPV
jgi:hypothetical protein